MILLLVIYHQGIKLVNQKIYFHELMKLIDTHSHIYYDKYKDDLSEVVNRATANNICNIICVGVDIDSSRKSIKVSEEYDMIYSTAGYHPHESKDAEKMYLDQLQDLLAHPKVVALGEIGLDYYYNHSDHKTQIRVFREQLELAKTLDIPVIIHNREADNDLYENLKDSGISKGVIHCYLGNLEEAKNFIDLGMYLGFTGVITFDKKGIMEEIIKYIPDEINVNQNIIV